FEAAGVVAGAAHVIESEEIVLILPLPLTERINIGLRATIPNKVERAASHHISTLINIPRHRLENGAHFRQPFPVGVVGIELVGRAIRIQNVLFAHNLEPTRPSLRAVLAARAIVSMPPLFTR